MPERTEGCHHGRPIATHLAPYTCHLTRCHLTSDAEEMWKLKGNVQAKKSQAEDSAGNAVALIGAISMTLV